MIGIQEQRKDVFMEIYGVSVFSDVLDLFEDDYKRYKNKGLSKIQELYKHYSYAIFFMYSPSSIRNNLVKFKNVIKKNGGKYQANAIEAFSVDSVYAPIKAKDEDRKENIEKNVLNGEVATLAPSVLESQINVFRSELEEKSYKVAKNQKEPNVRAYRILAMLSLAMGRRFTETMKTLIITKHGKKVVFNGLLKGNNPSIEGHIIGLSYLDAKKYLKELRAFSKTENMTESEVNKKYSKVFNNALKRFDEQDLLEPQISEYFSSVKREYRGEMIKGEPNVKGCRDLYAKVGSQLFHDKSKDRDFTQTASRILGHKYVIQSSEGYISK